MNPWTTACQAPLSSAVSWNLFKFMSTESTVSSSAAHLSFCLQSLPASESFPMRWLFTSSGQFPSGLTGLISLLSKGLSRVFSSTTVQKHQFFGAQPSLWSNSHIYTWLLEKTCIDALLSSKWCLYFKTLSRFVIAFLPGSKSLLISRLQFTVILEPPK